MSAEETPHTEGPSRDYWAGMRRGELVLQRCGDCGQVRHYPRTLCARCHSFAVETVTATGRGEIHSWTITHHVFDPAVGGDVPFALVTVDLEEGVRALARFSELNQLRPGLPVLLEFHQGAGERQVPVFVPDEDRPDPVPAPVAGVTP